MKCRHIFSLLLIFCLILCCAPAAFADDLPTDGQCGDNALWHYDVENNVLTITGTGEIWDYDYYTNTAPWREYYWCIEKLVIGEGITTTGEKAFFAMSNLHEAELPNTLTAIEVAAFSGCHRLTSVVIPDSVTSIGEWAFNECSNLESITLSDNLETISVMAFCNSKLSQITIPASVREISGSTFYRCNELTQFQVEEGSSYYQVKDGILYTADGKTLVRVPADLSGIYHVPSGVINISNYAFSGSNVSEVVLPDGMEMLDSYVFSGCAELTNVVLPKSLKNIGSYTFEGTSISRLVIPENVHTISTAIFNGCSSLEAVIFLGDEPYDDYQSAMNGAPENLTIYYSTSAQGWTGSWQGYPTQAFNDSFTTTASCTAAGVETVTCEALELEYSRNVLPLGHDMCVWDLKKAPGAAAKGQWSLACSRCGYAETRDIPALACEDLYTVITNNAGDQDYYVWTSVINSYLVKNDAGYQRVEYTGEYVTVEQYDEAFQLLSQKGIEAELPIFGGFYSDGTCNFLVFGHANPNEDNTVEVIRLVRYDLDWNRMDSASIFGKQIWLPFDAGSLRMVHNGDYLYIRTCDEGYALSDGNHHQSSRQILVHIPTMEIINTDMMGFVSHSFNQFILCDEEKIVYMDHGDAGNARGAVLRVWDDDVQLFEDVRIIVAHGNNGQNATGVSMGGLAMTESAYITAGNSILQDGSVGFHGQRNIFVTATPRQAPSTGKTTTLWLTNYPDGSDVYVTTPHLVTLNDQKLVILWTENEELRYAFLDKQGVLTSKIYACTGALSDCVPIVAEGKLLWYVTDGTKLTFYELDLSAPETINTAVITDNNTQPNDPEPNDPEPNNPESNDPEPTDPPNLQVEFTDVPVGAYYEEAVNWAVANEITNGIGGGLFAPDMECTREQVVTFLWRSAGCPEPVNILNPFSDISPEDYSYKAIVWAVEQGITKGISSTSFDPKSPCTRGQVCTFLWRAQGEPGVKQASNPFSDVEMGEYYYDAVLWAVENAVTNGIGGGKFAPDATCTRGQIVTFLYRSAS